MKKFITFFVALVITVSVSYSAIDTLTILHLSDTHSNMIAGGSRDQNLVGSIGGLARAATMIGLANQQNPGKTMLLHAGDYTTGDLLFNFYFGVPELMIYKSLGMSAIVLGNHEFDLQASTLNDAVAAAFKDGGIPLLSSNLIIPEDSLLNLKKYIVPNVINTYGNTKVGVFGLTSPITNMIAFPAPAMVSDELENFTIQAVTDLKTQGCDVIIMVSHLGIDVDEQLAQVPGIDLIIASHDHIILAEPKVVDNGSNITMIVESGPFYQHLGQAEIVVNDGKIRKFSWVNHFLDNTIPEEPTIKATIEALIADQESQYPVKLFTQKVAEATDNFREEATTRLLKGNNETPVGNLITDAYLALTNTDIALTAGTLTAEPLYKGALVGNDLYRMFGWGFNTDNGLGYKLTTFQMYGAALWGVLDWTLNLIAQNDEYFIMPGGMKYHYEVQYFNQPDETYKLAGKLLSVEIGGKPLEMDKIYTVTASEFIPYFLQTVLNIPIDSVNYVPNVSELEVVLGYASALGTITPKVEGRAICDAVTSVEDLRQLSDMNLSIYPNPVVDNSTVFFETREAGNGIMSIIDPMGREVYREDMGYLAVRSQSRSFNATKFAPGVYVIQIRSGKSVTTKSFVKI
jgi:5'-nucleotidase/UDP-sugar diphosphatase